MARIRTVKPQLARHRDLFDLERALNINARFAWAMLPTCADREGRFKWRPHDLKLDILPYDDVDFERLLEAWMLMGMVVKYRIAGKWYGWIPTFGAHQQINNREQASDLPSVDSADERIDHQCDPWSITRIVDGIHDNASSDASHSASGDASGTRGSGASPDASQDAPLGEGKGREGKGREEREQLCPAAPDVAVEVFDHWRLVMNHPGAKFTSERRRKVLGRLKDGYSVDDLRMAIKGCKLSPHHSGKNPTSTIYDDLELICRDGKRVEMFMREARQREKPESRLSSAGQQTAQALQRFVNQGEADADQRAQ